MQGTTNVECLVIGGGILGLLTALILREDHHYQVSVVTRAWDGIGIPLVDSLRNHSWRQSGLLYANQIPDAGDLPKAAYLMWDWGDNMFARLGVLPPTGRGIFCVKESTEDNLISAAKLLRMSSKVERLHATDAEELARDFYVPGQSYYFVPDIPFDEALLLKSAKEKGENAGVEFLSGDVTLQRSPSGQFFASVNEVVLRPMLLVLCAGARSLKLLDQVKVQHDLRVRSSGLIRMYGRNSALNAPLFVDRTNQLAVVRHEVTDVTPDGCLVIGSGHSAPVGIPHGDQRSFEYARKNEIASLLPSSLRQEARKSPATVGYKTERIIGGRLPLVDPVVEIVHPNLIYSVPGKATLAYYTANQIGSSANRLFGRPSRRRPSVSQPRTDLALPTWSDPLDSHHSARFYGVDETEYNS